MEEFYGNSPGQDLAEVVNRISIDDLYKILGKDIISLVEAISDPKDINLTLRRIATEMLREQAYTLMARRDIQKICFNVMSEGKLTELVNRLGVKDIAVFRSLDLTENTKTWQSFLGFFGIDTHEAVPFSLEHELEEVRANYGLFPHQRQVADRVCNAIRGGHGRVVLHMPTGAGKTRTAMHIVSKFMTASEPSIIVWLAASSELLDQAADAFQNAWSQLGNREVSILRYWGNYSPDLTTPPDCIIFAGLQKMYALKTRDHIGILRLAKSVKLVIVDEAHQAIAPTYRDIIDILTETGSNNALVGLTATPGRTWSDIAADEQLSEFFGGRKVMLEVEGWDDPVAFLIEQEYLARPTFRRLEFEATPDLKPYLKDVAKGDDYDAALLESLAEHLGRNVIIINEIRRLIENGHTRIILFGSSVQHAELLAAALSAVGIDGQVVTGKTNSTSRTRSIRLFRKSSTKPIVLCNFGVLTTGFDAPNTSAAVIARPTKSLVLFSQMVGRATRGPKAGGNKTCEISTVIDIDLPGFGDIADAFTNWEDVWHD